MKKIMFISMTLIMLLIKACSFPDAPSDGYVDLNASIRSSETQVILKNNDSFEYNNIIIEINKQFKAKYPALLPGEVLEIGFLQFTDKNHTKFNPFTTRASIITVTCQMKNGKKGYLYGEIN